MGEGCHCAPFSVPTSRSSLGYYIRLVSRQGLQEMSSPYKPKVSLQVRGVRGSKVCRGSRGGELLVCCPARCSVIVPTSLQADSDGLFDHIALLPKDTLPMTGLGHVKSSHPPSRGHGR